MKKTLLVLLAVIMLNGCQGIYNGNMERMAGAKDIKCGDKGEAIFYKDGVKYYILESAGSVDTISYDQYLNGRLKRAGFAITTEAKYKERLAKRDNLLKMQIENRQKQLEAEQKIEESKQIVEKYKQAEENEKFAYTGLVDEYNKQCQEITMLTESLPENDKVLFRLALAFFKEVHSDFIFKTYRERNNIIKDYTSELKMVLAIGERIKIIIDKTEPPKTITVEKTNEPNRSIEDVEKIISIQPVTVANTIVGIFGTQSIVTNATTREIKNVVVAMGGWNAEGFPVFMRRTILDKKNYIAYVQDDEINLKSHECEKIGKETSKADPVYVKSIVCSYEDFDGYKWQNPLKKEWVEFFEGKKLDYTNESRKSYDILQEELKLIEMMWGKLMIKEAGIEKSLLKMKAKNEADNFNADLGGKIAEIRAKMLVIVDYLKKE